jgi:hypothetical protein
MFAVDAKGKEPETAAEDHHRSQQLPLLTSAVKQRVVYRHSIRSF